jgi:hypothetical protein
LEMSGSGSIMYNKTDKCFVVRAVNTADRQGI